MSNLCDEYALLEDDAPKSCEKVGFAFSLCFLRLLFFGVPTSSVSVLKLPRFD